MRYLVLLVALFSFSSYASWDGSTRGEVVAIEVTAESNYAFRIHLKNAPALCGNANTWAFLNKSDSNYETYVSLLTAAKFAQAEVTVYTNQISNGFCKIGHITVH
ncbi:hypothetical protein [Agarilytica rhodophyticola]|uniref:hypothetical protein n=1 Tax=Agarilytica rhodophyticola TaxID=1737490 RepID=UPI000B342109|nr:hypothetical protein [Agarilytica rhodophyticola]